MVDVKEHVRSPRRVRFVKATARELWYETELGFRFPVPLADVGDATFLAEDKAMLFMRYVRRHAQELEVARQAA